jgi:hypothetical protein
MRGMPLPTQNMTKLHPSNGCLRRIHYRFGRATEAWEEANSRLLQLWANLNPDCPEPLLPPPDPFSLADDVKRLARAAGTSLAFRKLLGESLYEFKATAARHISLVHGDWFEERHPKNAAEELLYCFRRYRSICDHLYWPEGSEHFRDRYKLIDWHYEAICAQENRCRSLVSRLAYQLAHEMLGIRLS